MLADTPPARPAEHSRSLRGSALFQRRWTFEVAYLVLLLAAAGLILSVVGRHAGWPLGDAFTEELILVRLYAAHFRHLDFFPVWSSSDALGLGSPVLLYYQKAFFYVAGFVYILLGGNLKATLIVSIAAFMMVGAYGMRSALSLLTRSRLLCTVGSIGFLFTNYVFTDWLSRGDLPEFAAMMIVPWLLYWCIRLLVRRQVSLVLIPTLVLLVDAHSAIALLAILTLAVALGTFVAVAGLGGLRAVLPRLAVAVGGTVVLLAPTLLAEVRMAQFYDPQAKVTNYGNVANAFLPFHLYFVDTANRWLAANAHTFVQIDYAIWVPIVIGLAALAWASRTRRDRRPAAPERSRVDGAVLAFLLITLGAYLLLQLHVTLSVYDILSPLKIIAYPFRMMALVTPLGVVLVVLLAEPFYARYHAHAAARVVPLVWLASLVLLSPVPVTAALPRSDLGPAGAFPPTDLSAPPSVVDYRTFHGLFTLSAGLLYPEYLPKVYSRSGKELADDTNLYARLHAHQYGAAALGPAACSVLVPTHVPLEALQLTFTVHCTAPARLALPVSTSPYTTVSVLGPGGSRHRVPTIHLRTDPRLIVRVTSSRSEVLVVSLPTLWGILS